MIEDYQINQDKTKLAQKDKKFLNFISWFTKNGGIIDGINFPTAFGPTGYTGISAKQDVPSNKVIMAIPNKMIISTTNIQDQQITKLIKENGLLFSKKKNDDSEFNIMILTLIIEKLKKDQSFWAPYFAVVEPQTISSWSQQDLQQTEDNYLIKKAKEYKSDLDESWEEFNTFTSKYPKIFGKNFTKSIYVWAYEFTMTRSFSESLPGTFIVPMADFLNHSKKGVKYFLINKKFEQNEKLAHQNYKIKNKHLDLSILQSFKFQLSAEQLKKLNLQNSEIYQYIEKNIGILDPQYSKKLPEIEAYSSRQQLSVLSEINYTILKNEKNKQIWELPYFESSDSEDNDTDSDDETALGKNDGFSRLKEEEIIELEQQQSNKKDEEFKYDSTMASSTMSIYQKNDMEKMTDKQYDWYSSGVKN